MTEYDRPFSIELPAKRQAVTMAATVASWLGYIPSLAGDKELPDEPPKALPASWYYSPEIYQLERRAIFSKRWILVTHKLRFTKPGDFLRFEEAGFSFVLCLDREGNLNGFHNICRHRAYPLVSEDEGNVKILSCTWVVVQPQWEVSQSSQV